MTMKLAVLAPHLGCRSETFIRRHIDDLLPGKTVLVSNKREKPFGGHWDVECPKLLMNVELNRLNFKMRNHLGGFWGRSLNGESRVVERFLRQQKVTVALGEYLDFSIDWCHLMDRLKIAYFIQAHGIDVSSYLCDRKRAEEVAYICRNVAGIFTRSEFHRNRLLEIGFSENKLYVNPGGVTVDQEWKVRERGEYIFCLAVGRIVPKKGPIFLLDAFRRAAQNCPRLRLDYVGSGPLFPAMRQYVQAHRMGEVVTLHGGVEPGRLAELQARANLFLQHSITDPDTGDEEGLPAAIQEAMGQSLPVVSTRHAGIPEAVEHEITGLLSSPGDSKEMARMILLMAEDEKGAAEMSLRAWKKASRDYRWEDERSRLLSAMGIL